MQRYSNTDITNKQVNQPTSPLSADQNEKAETLIKEAIEKKDPTILLKAACDLYKKSSMHSEVVKCHVIYMAIKLDLDIQEELDEWYQYLLKYFNHSNLNLYLVSHFLNPRYKQEGLIKIGQSYWALKETLSLFACYDNDDNFKKYLKKRCVYFHSCDAFLEPMNVVYQSIRDRLTKNENNLNDNEINNLKKYINDYLWIINEIHEEKTEIYKNLLSSKYYLYKILIAHYMESNPSEVYSLYLAVSQFDALDEIQYNFRGSSLLLYCEARWIKEDNFPGKAILKDRQSMCKIAINDFREALILTKSTEFSETVLKFLIRCIILYINYEFLFSDDIAIDKTKIYKDYKNYLENRVNISLVSTINDGYCFIFNNTNINNIEETKKIIHELLNLKIRDKNINNKIKSIEKYSEVYFTFLTIQNAYYTLLKRTLDKETKVKEYKNFDTQINKFLNELQNDSNMNQFKYYLEKGAILINADIKVSLAWLTKDKGNIESAKKAMREANKDNDESDLFFHNYFLYKLLGIKFYEAIPALGTIKDSVAQFSTESGIYNRLIGYFNVICSLKLQKENFVCPYDANKSLSENFLINFEINRNEFCNNAVKKIDIFLITEAMLELLEDTNLKEKYINLYNTLTKDHLKNFNNLLDEEIIEDKFDKFYLYQYYIKRYKTISHNDNEDKEDSINIYLKYYELIKTFDQVKVNDLIDDAIDRFPNKNEFFKIKLSLLKDYVCPIVLGSKEELPLPPLSQKFDLNKINEVNKSNRHKELENDREVAYKRLQEKREALIKSRNDYSLKKEKLNKLIEKIKKLNESIKLIDIEHVTFDDELKIKIKKFIKKNKAIAQQEKEYQLTTEELQKDEEEFAKATTLYKTADNKFNEFITRKEQMEKEKVRKEVEAQEKKEKMIEKKKAEQEEKAKKVAEDKREKERKDAELRAKQQELIAKEKIDQELKAKKAAQVKAEKERKDAEFKLEIAKKFLEAHTKAELKAEEERKNAEVKLKIARKYLKAHTKAVVKAEEERKDAEIKLEIARKHLEAKTKAEVKAEEERKDAVVKLEIAKKYLEAQTEAIKAAEKEEIARRKIESTTQLNEAVILEEETVYKARDELISQNPYALLYGPNRQLQQMQKLPSVPTKSYYSSQQAPLPFPQCLERPYQEPRESSELPLQGYQRFPQQSQEYELRHRQYAPLGRQQAYLNQAQNSHQGFARLPAQPVFPLNSFRQTDNNFCHLLQNPNTLYGNNRNSMLSASAEPYFPLQPIVSKVRQTENNNFSQKSAALDTSYTSKISDHTHQCITVRFESKNKEFQISGFTWNLMDQMFSDKTHYFKNNPHNLDENDNDYLLRKELQLEKILKLIKEGRMDFVLLQEVDIFDTTPRFLRADQKRLYDLQNKFLKELNKEGWKLIYPKSLLNQQKLVTLYNTNTFEINTIENSTGIIAFEDDNSTSMRGAELILKHKASNNEVNLTNLHLKWGDSHVKQFRQQILNHKLRCKTNGQILIAGGDFNNPIQYFDSTLADLSRTTNLRGELKDNQMHLKRTHERKDVVREADRASGKKATRKAYDGFVVEGLHILSCTIFGEEFKKEASGRYTVVPSMEKVIDLRKQSNRFDRSQVLFNPDASVFTPASPMIFKPIKVPNAYQFPYPSQTNTYQSRIYDRLDHSKSYYDNAQFLMSRVDGTTLNLMNCNITDSDVLKIIIIFLCGHAEITRVNLSNNDIGDDSARALFRAFNDSKSFDFENTRVTIVPGFRKSY